MSGWFLFWACFELFRTGPRAYAPADIRSLTENGATTLFRQLETAKRSDGTDEIFLLRRQQEKGPIELRCQQPNSILRDY